MTTTVTTVRLSGKRKQIVEYIALQAGAKCGQLLRKSDVIHFLIDRYGNAETIDALVEKYGASKSPLALRDSNENTEE